MFNYWKNKHIFKRYRAIWRHPFTSRRHKVYVDAVQLTRPRIFILPTRFGMLFVLGLFIMLLGAMNYNNSMGYMLIFLLGSLFFISMLHTHRNLLGLQVAVGQASPVFAGETAYFQLWLDNRGQTARYALTWQCEENAATTLVTDVSADQKAPLLLAVPTHQRGRVHLGRITVYTLFPLGLFRAWAYIYLNMSTLAYPQPLGRRTLPQGVDEDGVNQGHFYERGGEDFIGYRDYKIGDSPRHVDWKAVARGQDWLVKQFGGLNSSTTVWLNWEQVESLNDLEAALSQLCLWITIAEAQQMRYGLKIPTAVFVPDNGAQHREQCLSALALYTAG